MHWDLQHHRISAAEKPDIVDCAREGCEENQTEGACVRDRQPSAGSGFDCLVDDVKDNLLPFTYQQTARPEDDPDIGDGTDFKGP
jgi:hypothetical protein